jgi:predicted 3-demethylubiquinone-9 3-methyltransferase (glyoxalase superfamily)
MQTIQKISPFLWFDNQAEEAANFYASTFPNSSVGKITRYGKSFPDKQGTAMTVTFNLFGQEFIALNGGPIFTFTPAISFLVRCENQPEVDDLWQKLTDGGQESQCGWLKDKFGVSWQIVPNALSELLADPDPARAHRVTQAMLGMKKIDIEALKRARDS